MNYGALQTEVERNVIDLPTAVQNGVPTFINRAMKALQRRHNFKVMEAETSYTTTAGSHILSATMPTRFKEFRDQPFYVTDDDSTWYEMEYAPNMTAIRRRMTDEAEGAPEFLLEGEPSTDDYVSALEVYPLPDDNSDWDDGEYRIYVPYWAYVADLSAEGDSNWFTVNAQDWLIFKATAEAFFTDWDENRASIWEQRAANMFNDIIMLDKRYRLGGVRELVPHWQGAKKAFVRR